MEDNNTYNEEDVFYKSDDDAKETVANATGTGMQAAGKATSAAGTGIKYAGKGMNFVGKGISNASDSLKASGKSLSSTGYGAVVGVPLSAAGYVGTGVGKATELAGKGVETTGDVVKKTGNTIDKTGRKIKYNNKKGNSNSFSDNLKKYKLAIIIGGIVLLIIILFMLIIMVLDSTGIIKDSDSNKSDTVSYSEITSNVNGANNENLWWPIGSSEVTTSIDMDGNIIDFRSGAHIVTNLTSGYKTEKRPNHAAIDVSIGGDVYLIAMADGEITSVECGTDAIPCTRDSGYNTYSGDSNSCTSEGEVRIVIKYNNGYESRYLHLENSSIPEYLQEGSKVYQGQVVGKMGNTGCSDGQHLHLEIIVNNENVNPQNYVSSDNPRPLPEGITKKSEDILKDYYEKQKESLTEENIVGNDNKQKVCFALKNYYSDNVVAGLMVNIERESSFDPTNVTLDSNNKYSGGLFQWNAGRLNLLKSMYGNQWTLISNQIEYFRYEISTTEYRTAPILSDTSLSVSEVAYQFCLKFERAKNCSPRKSETLANKYSTYVKNGCE